MHRFSFAYAPFARGPPRDECELVAGASALVPALSRLTLVPSRIMTLFLPKLLEHHPELEDAVTWLKKRGTDLEPLLAGARQDLASAGNFPPLPRLCAYFKVMVIGEFLVRWKAKNAHRPWNEIAEDGDATELKLVQRTIIATADVAAFRKTLPLLTRQRQAEQLGVHLGDESDFESFVATESGEIARKVSRLTLNEAGISPSMGLVRGRVTLTKLAGSRPPGARAS